VLESHFGDKVNLSLIDLRGIQREFAIYHIPECDVYLQSVYTLDYAEQISIAKAIRSRFPDAKHIGGGPHATEFQEECLKTFDTLILGEGEESIIKAISDLVDLKLEKVYKQKRNIDINQYPYPSRKYLSKSSVARRGLMDLKNKKGYGKLLSTTVMFSRGCPYKCCFCYMPQTKEYGMGLRYRSPELIEEEIEYLKREYNMEGINLLDEIGIPLTPKQAIPHLEAIGRTGIKWRGQCRVDGITSEIAKAARESGCIAMGLGVESISQRAIEMANKGVTVTKSRETITLLKRNDIEVRIYIIMGLPGEPDDITEQTWDFVKETSPDLVYLSLFTIRPGTDIYNNPKKYGIKHIETKWENTMHMYGRFEHEVPKLNFEYADQTPWGKARDKDRIVSEYIELQTRLREGGYNF
tara:strand:- start:1645 stop:2877 length:1233 start_codon:yes stop_codon:yes gene_type:complete